MRKDAKTYDMANLIDIMDAARWMTKMAATDGVITPSERMVLKEFAETNGLDSTKLIRMAYAIANDKSELPEVERVDPSELKGRQFEEFVVSLCSDKSRFTLLAWRSDKIIGHTYALENLMPDLHLRHRLCNGEVEYLVECKYRSSLPEGVLDLSGKLDRYLRLGTAEANCELFIALGIGGTPSNPDMFYMIPARMLKHDAIIRIKNFNKCLCPKSPDAFHAYIEHFYNKRASNQIGTNHVIDKLEYKRAF